MRDLAERLLAIEAEAARPSDPQLSPAARVCETFRASLTRLAGAEGFAALMRRAVVLTRGEVPSVQAVVVNVDGSIEGLADIEPEASVALAAQLLGLLVTFIGEPLTMRLVVEAWPDLGAKSIETQL